MDFNLYCPSCGKRYKPVLNLWKCICDSPLNVEKKLERGGELKGWGIWRYKLFIPLLADDVVTLGEGGTPIVSRKIEGVEVLLKLEYMNPTGSFKDRGASVMISNLKALNAENVVIDSSGNAGVAVAAYCAAAGISCRVYVPFNAPSAKKRQILLHGAELVEIPGPRGSISKKAIEEVSRGAVYASHMWNPFFIEGLKTIAYECCEQTGAPDAVILPVGSGGLLLGVYWGFREAKEIGLIEDVPRLIAVQSVGFTPLYDAIYGPYGVEPPTEPFADGIAIPNPPRLRQLVEVIRESKGDVVVVDDRETFDALLRLAKTGFLVEPTSATALAAFQKAKEKGLLETGERTLLPLTGTGLKALEKIVRIRGVD
ncbi:MAG: threonine synthase [Thermofilaceae archaeon]|nr:threonine synthase [Thermofilaceae archaeon]MCX8180163.1 threonine synthase [Thermofilaceae archaeon]MDW8004181.1 threonine synthase [Thermofilaceae archaeon]